MKVNAVAIALTALLGVSSASPIIGDYIRERKGSVHEKEARMLCKKDKFKYSTKVANIEYLCNDNINLKTAAKPANASNAVNNGVPGGVTPVVPGNYPVSQPVGGQVGQPVGGQVGQPMGGMGGAPDGSMPPM